VTVPQSLFIGDEAQRIGAPSSRHTKLREAMRDFTVIVETHEYRIHGREAVYC